MSSPIRDRTVLLSMLDFVNKLMYILIYIYKTFTSLM